MKHILFVLLLSASMTVVAQETMPATGATQAQQTMGDETYTDIYKEYTDDPLCVTTKYLSEVCKKVSGFRRIFMRCGVV